MNGSCKIIFIYVIGLIFLSNASKAQAIERPVEKVTDPKELARLYSDLSKKQRKTGWILLGSGVGLMVAGSQFSKAENSEVGAILFTSGFLSSIPGITYLSIASSNKLKAKIFMKKETLAGGKTVGLPFTLTTAGIGIPIGNR